MKIGDENCLQIEVWNSCKEICQNKLSILFNFRVLNQFIDVRGDWDFKSLAILRDVFPIIDSIGLNIEFNLNSAENFLIFLVNIYITVPDPL